MTKRREAFPSGLGVTADWLRFGVGGAAPVSVSFASGNERSVVLAVLGRCQHLMSSRLGRAGLVSGAVAPALGENSPSWEVAFRKALLAQRVRGPRWPPSVGAGGRITRTGSDAMDWHSRIRTGVEALRCTEYWTADLVYPCITIMQRTREI
jgi:hypothetical protein